MTSKSSPSGHDPIDFSFSNQLKSITNRLMTLADLNSDALAELEAKLSRDLEMVRRVRALLLEHQAAPSFIAPAPAPQVPEAATPPQPAPPRVPVRPIDDILADALPTMPEEGFFIDDLKQACRKSDRVLPDSDTVKTFLKQGVRKGLVVVAEVRSGRRGSLYKRALSQLDSLEKPLDSPIASLD